MFFNFPFQIMFIIIIYFRHHMRSMHQMSSMMNSMFQPPSFGGGMMGNFGPSIPMGFGSSPLVPMGFPAMPNMNRLLGKDFSQF